jgi:hypothetical protein
MNVSSKKLIEKERVRERSGGASRAAHSRLRLSALLGLVVTFFFPFRDNSCARCIGRKGSGERHSRRGRRRRGQAGPIKRRCLIELPRRIQAQPDRWRDL